jgi:hypothetical protein
MAGSRPLATWSAAVAAATLLSCSKGVPTKAARAQLSAGGVTWRVLSGSWRTEGDALVGSGGRIQSVTDLTDGTLEMDIEERGATGHTVGVGFRYLLVDDDPLRSSGYTLNLGDHAFNVFRGANNYWVPVNPDLAGGPLTAGTTKLATSSLIDPKKDHVVLRMKGQDFEIDVNGAALMSFTDAACSHGHVHLWVEAADQVVVFSNLHVRS